MLPIKRYSKAANICVRPFLCCCKLAVGLQISFLWIGKNVQQQKGHDKMQPLNKETAKIARKIVSANKKQPPVNFGDAAGAVHA